MEFRMIELRSPMDERISDVVARCHRCRHHYGWASDWCVCAGIPPGSAITLGLDGKAIGYTEAPERLGVLRINRTAGSASRGLPPGEYTIPAAAVKVHDGGRIEADMSQAKPKALPAKLEALAPRLINSEWALNRHRLMILRLDFACASNEQVTQLQKAMAEHVGKTAEEIAHSHHEIKVSQGDRVAVGMDPALAAPYLGGPSLSYDAYAAGVAAAREAIAVAKYDAERDHKEWSVRDVEVPPYAPKGEK
jgi:hypothetical protein